MLVEQLFAVFKMDRQRYLTDFIVQKLLEASRNHSWSARLPHGGELTQPLQQSGCDNQHLVEHRSPADGLVDMLTQCKSHHYVKLQALYQRVHSPLVEGPAKNIFLLFDDE